MRLSLLNLLRILTVASVTRDVPNFNICLQQSIDEVSVKARQVSIILKLQKCKVMFTFSVKIPVDPSDLTVQDFFICCIPGLGLY